MKTISRILILTMLHLCWLTSYGYAEMIPTESAAQSQVETDRQRILDLLDRQEVVDELEKYGITKVEAVARINSLTDEEVTRIAGKLDELPKGGYRGIESLLLPFYILGIIVSIIPVSFICLFKEGKWCDCIDEAYSKGAFQGVFNSVEDGAVSSSEGAQCVSPCYSEFSTCMKKVGEAASIEHYCMEERDRCLQKCEGKEYD